MNDPINKVVTLNGIKNLCLTDKGDDYMKTLSRYEDRKGQLLEGILCELKSLREIQQERLNLEREKFQFMQTMDSNSLLSSIIKF